MDEPSAAAIEPEQAVGGLPPSMGPMGYVTSTIKIVQLDTDTIVRISRDPRALVYGAIVLGLTSLLRPVIAAAILGLPTPGALTLAMLPVLGIVGSLVSTGILHVAAKVLFDATGTYVGLLRVLWLASFLSLLIVVPIVGGFVGGIWLLLISMVTFQEVDGIERLQALVLSLGLGAALAIISILARGAAH